MRYVAAYLLARLGGNEDPSAADVASIIASVGVDIDAKQLDHVIELLKGKSIEKVMETGISERTSYYRHLCFND